MTRVEICIRHSKQYKNFILHRFYVPSDGYPITIMPVLTSFIESDKDLCKKLEQLVTDLAVLTSPIANVYYYYDVYLENRIIEIKDYALKKDGSFMRKKTPLYVYKAGKTNGSYAKL